MSGLLFAVAAGRGYDIISHGLSISPARFDKPS
jgi:hypothetical protein